MRFSLILLPILARLNYALPQAASASASCATSTAEVIIPTKTVTYTTTPISTIYASGAEDLGTFTSVVRIPSTSTIATVTSTSTICARATGAAAAVTVYTTAGAASPTSRKRSPLAVRQDACTVTTTFTTTVGQTYVFVPGTTTRTYTAYTAYTQETVTVSTYIGTSYIVASASATVTPAAEACTAVVLDARCNPSAMVSAAGGVNGTQYGLEWKSDVPSSGGSYSTTASDASTCCQMCADMADTCAGSAWDVRTNACTLEFAVNPVNGQLNCGESLLAYYDAGPLSPMAPGTGWWVANICGSAEYGSAAPDDGS